MPKKLCIQVCRNYYPEVLAVIEQEQMSNVTVQAYPPVCMHPQLKQSVLDRVLQQAQSDEDQILLAGGCGLGKMLDPQSPLWTQTQSLVEVYQLKYCFHMLANPDLIEHFSQNGGYLVTPGWLTFWRSTLQDWGFDQQTARSFFQECSQRLVFLDTGVDTLAAKNLADFAEYVELPTQVIPLGLDHFQLMLSKIVQEWQVKQKEDLSTSSINLAQQQLANYALAFDLLANLTQMMTEADAVREINHIFSMLFAPGGSTYISLAGGQLQHSIVNQPSSEQTQRLLEWASNSQEGYRRLDDQNGFYLRISYQSATLGAIAIHQVTFPQYLQQYLNMSLVLAPLCGLTISNARAYQKLEEKEIVLHKLATTDSLTELFNRRHFYELAEVEFNRSRRYHRSLSAIAIDIDHFKQINDTYSHAAGDQVLVEFAQLLTREMRGSDIRARMGGEEFVILLPETSLPLARFLTDRLCQRIAEMVVEVNGVSIQITASLGIACLDENCASLKDLLHHSDLALYQAKDSGRNQVAVWQGQ